MDFIDDRRVRKELALPSSSKRAPRGQKKDAMRLAWKDGMPEPDFIAEHVRYFFGSCLYMGMPTSCGQLICMYFFEQYGGDFSKFATVAYEAMRTAMIIQDNKVTSRCLYAVVAPKPCARPPSIRIAA